MRTGGKYQYLHCSHVLRMMIDVWQYSLRCGQLSDIVLQFMTLWYVVACHAVNLRKKLLITPKYACTDCTHTSRFSWIWTHFCNLASELIMDNISYITVWSNGLVYWLLNIQGSIMKTWWQQRCMVPWVISHSNTACRNHHLISYYP